MEPCLYILPIMLYVSECWTGQGRCTANRCIGSVGPLKDPRYSLAWLRQEWWVTQQHSLSSVVKSRRLCLRNRQITGEDTQGGHLHLNLKCLQRPVLVWHGSFRSQGGNSQPTFLADVNEAWLSAPIAVHTPYCIGYPTHVLMRVKFGTKGRFSEKWAWWVKKLIV